MNDSPANASPSLPDASMLAAKPKVPRRSMNVSKASQERIAGLLEWLTTERATQYFGVAHQRKIIALAWTANPSAFDGKSLSQLAAGLGVTKQALGRYTAKARRDFKLPGNGAQRAHGGRFRERGQPGR
jgi:hypothetical protein